MSQEHPAPRAELVRYLNARDPYAIEVLIANLHTISDTAFTEVCELVSKIAATQDPKAAVDAARAEVDKRPARARV